MLLKTKELYRHSFILRILNDDPDFELSILTACANKHYQHSRIRCRCY